MKLLMILILGFLPGVTLAMGFGKVNLYSFLDEPLDAEIELLDTDPFQAEHILASLSQTQEFKQAGLMPSDLLKTLQFKISREASKTLLKITSQEPIRQPSLEFLIDLIWPSGYMVQGYVILLDPLPAGVASIPDRRSSSLKSYTRSSTILLSNQQPLNPEQNHDPDRTRIPAPTSMTVVSNFPSHGASEISSSDLQREDAPFSAENNVPEMPALEIIDASSPLESIVKPREEWLMTGMAATGSALLMVLILLLIRRKKIRSLPIPAPVSASGFSSEAFYNAVESIDPTELADPIKLVDSVETVGLPEFVAENKDKGRQESLLYADEMTLKLKLAQYYFAMGDKDNAVSLLKDVQERGRASEKERADKLLNEIILLKK